MRLWGVERFDPNAVDRKALEAAVNALSDTWKLRRRATQAKYASSAIQKGRSATLTIELEADLDHGSSFPGGVGP
ncbi:hypothetical protein QA645_39925 [Bradyrhizobium sp. CIAT3101]|uniref:hypothetical protein n=1 Tax=Bradyrhizobium sp. CIAT3101 TaxID=439387 RepID=UPI0024B0CA8F|nr:hypothetical protein [Bradyrhizobium sp. CIAT3101]WFU80555.1 hypothetical protein QA645_39925 [Bradyrhizobium sp. CIAT3101]